MKNFSFLKNQVSFSDTIINYNEIYIRYYKLAAQYAYQFEKEYDAFGSMEKLAENCSDVGISYIKKGVNQVIQDLMKLRIYDVSIEEIFYKYGANFLPYWFDSYDMVIDQYLALEKNAQELEQMRKLRRQNRDRFVGGGFGISGAIKGMATAGVLNAASGAVHGIVNTTENVLTSIGNNLKASQIYNNEKNKQILGDGLFLSILNLNYIYCNYANIEIPQFYPEKVKALLKNFIHIPQYDKAQALCDCLQYNPYDFSIYKQAISEYGDKENEIQLIASSFGMEELVEEYKLALLKSSCNFKSIDDIKDKATALNLYTNLQKNIKILGINNSPSLSSLMLSLEDKIENFDKQERTYSNHVYSDISSAKRAKIDDDFVNAQLKKISAATAKQQLIDIRETIKSHCITEYIVSNATKKIDKFIYLYDIIGNAETSESEQVACETLHIIERECERTNEFESFYQKIYYIILKFRYKNLDFQLYTSKNANLMTKSLEDIKKEFGELPECDIITQMQNVISTNKSMFSKAKLYSNNRPIRLLPGVICLIIFAFLGNKIPVIGKYVKIFFLILIAMVILGSIIQLFNPTYDGISKKACKRAYEYFKSHGESV